MLAVHTRAGHTGTLESAKTLEPRNSEQVLHYSLTMESKSPNILLSGLKHGNGIIRPQSIEHI